MTPALSVAEALQESGPVRTIFAGPAGGVAERMVGYAGGEFVPLEVQPLRGAGLLRWARGLADLPAGAARSLRILRELRPDIVVGTGAHTSGPIVAVAAASGIPTLLFEANVEVGLANRCLGPMVHAAAVAWPQTLNMFPERGFLSGCPVGRPIREAASSGCDRVTGRFNLLVMGGSAGSSDIDRAMQDAIPYLGRLTGSLSVIHQACPGEVVALRERYSLAGVEAQVEPFFQDLAGHYLRASLVVTRPGGLTLGELGAVGRPAILVPLPAAGDHQRANARAWEEAGCARSFPPQEVTGRTLAEAILSLAEDPVTLDRMGEAARAQYRPDAARRVAERCLLSMRPR